MYGYWQARFGGDRSVVGRTIMADGRARQIIGVMPERFRFLDLKPSLILPMQMDRGQVHLGNFSYQGLARLKPGVSMAQASADVARMIPIAIRSFPAFPGISKKIYEDLGLTPFLRPLEQDVTGTIAGALSLLRRSIEIVLLIACATWPTCCWVRAGGRRRSWPSAPRWAPARKPSRRS